MDNTHDERKITHVYHWQNDMVMVFDQFSEQMPEYQGPIEKVKEKIKSVYDGPWMQGDYPARKVWLKPDEQRTNGPEIEKIIVDEVSGDVNWEKVVEARKLKGK